MVYIQHWNIPNSLKRDRGRSWEASPQFLLPVSPSDELLLFSGRWVSKERHWPSPPGLPRWLSGEEPTCQSRGYKRHSHDPWVVMTPGEGNSNPVHNSCLENPMDSGTWRASVHGVAKTVEPGELQSVGLQGSNSTQRLNNNSNKYPLADVQVPPDK